MSVRVEGDVSFAWEDNAPLDMLIATPSTRETHLFSAGIPAFVKVHSQHEQFRWALDLIGGYDGPGSYQVRGTEDGSSSMNSTAFFVYLELIDPSLENPYVSENYTRAQVFDHVVQDCALEVGEAEETGSLTCPELADEHGKTIGLQVAWKVEAPHEG